MKQLSRRSFLRLSVLASAAPLLPGFAAEQHSAPVPAPAQARVAGANGDIRVAVAGLHGRGKSHVEGVRAVKGARVVALCDVDREVLEAEARKCEDRGEPVQTYSDIRKLLENQDVDAVTFATPNHWHALGSIWAIQAGKDVYVEKPVSHNVWEGRQLVAAARKHQRMVQAGTQSRSSHGIKEAIAWLRGGHLGKTLRARGLCYKRRPSIGKVAGPQPIPPSVDYDLWCGPAPKGPLLRQHLHYDWHWVWPTGNGDVGNQGVHEMDLARWFLGETTLAPRVWSLGGRLGYEDDGTTPNTQIMIHEYAAAPLIFEVRGLPAGTGAKEMDQYRSASIGVVVDCEGGSVVVGSAGARVFDKDGQQLKSFQGTSSHFENFINAVRSRDRTQLHAEVIEGHLSSALCHIGNISYRLGQPHSPQEIRAAVRASPDLAEALGRMEQHLAANAVDLEHTPATLGALLTIDPKTERFVGDPQANSLLTRDYREPFVVPANV